MYTGLQVARGVAAILVLLLHASKSVNIFFDCKSLADFWKFGAIGVDFFFVLSGFIIYWIHSKDKDDLQSMLVYLKKRVIRIYPPFILISIALLIAYKLFPSLSLGNKHIGIITSLFLIPTPPLEPALAIFWTMMHEVLFYVFFTLFYIKNKLFPIALILWGLLIFLAYFYLSSGIIKTFILNPHNLQFILGIVAAFLIIKEKGSYLHLIVGVIMIVFYILYIEGNHGYNIPLNNLEEKLYLGISFMLIVIGLCQLEEKIKFPNIFIYLGAASYSIYLIHTPVLSLLIRLATKIDNYVDLQAHIIFIPLSVLTLLVGCLYHISWEKPVLNVLRKKYLAH